MIDHGAVTAELHQAVIHFTGPSERYATGVIGVDAKGRFQKGVLICTSGIEEGPDDDGFIRTRNSIYRLADWVAA